MLFDAVAVTVCRVTVAVGGVYSHLLIPPAPCNQQQHLTYIYHMASGSNGFDMGLGGMMLCISSFSFCLRSLGL